MSWLTDLQGVNNATRSVSLPSQRISEDGVVRPAALEAAKQGNEVATGTRNRVVRLLPFITALADIVVITVSLLLAVAWRNSIHMPGQVPGFDAGHRLGIYAPAILAGWLAVTWIMGGYRSDVFGAGVDEYKRVLYASGVAAALTGLVSYLAKEQVPRGFFLIAFTLGAALLLLSRYVMRQLIQRARAMGHLGYRVVIVGTEGHVDEMGGVLKRESWLGYNVIGAVLPTCGRKTETSGGISLLGDAAAVAEIAMIAQADIVFLAGGAFDSATQLRQVAWDLEHEDIQVMVAPSVTDVSNERVRFRPVGGMPLIHIDKPRGQRAIRWAKRSFDFFGSLALIIAFSPIFAFAAIRIWLNDRGPVIFKQPRAGRDGQEFECLKFRTMVTNAEELLAELHEQQGYEGGLFKMDNDPRITKPGAWLRRFSIDELPQLFNVLRGDMSLVGPRPPLGREVAQYDDFARRRLAVRPGMTGLWQVSGRSDLSWEEAIRLDLYYVDNWSMFQDLSILLRTFSAVFGSKGAY